jgi:hypothetical protein
MQKLILISVIIASIAIPAWAAREPSPGRGLKKAVLLACLANLIYVVMVVFVYPRV